MALPTPLPRAPTGHGPGAAAALQPFVDRQVIAGAVGFVADKDKVIVADAVGLADVAAHKPMDPNAVFWIASMTKPITATALMMLVDESKVHLDDPVEKYLPEFKGQMVVVEKDDAHMLLKRPVHPILVRNVLSHTSGLPRASLIEHPTLDLSPLERRVRSYAMQALEFEPDSKYQYTNEGLNTAARIIEVASGMPFATFLQTRLFDPLGMKDTTFWPQSGQIARLAKSYRSDGTKLHETTIRALRAPFDDRTRQPNAGGGLFSTGSDLVRFGQMILNGGEFHGRRFLSPGSIRLMCWNELGTVHRGDYGFGWHTTPTAQLEGAKDESAIRSYGHAGAYGTELWIYPQQGVLTVMLIQSATILRSDQWVPVQAAFASGVKPDLETIRFPSGVKIRREDR